MRRIIARLSLAAALGLALLAPSARAEEPTAVSASADYSMESSIEVLGVTQEPQAAAAYAVHSQKDFEVAITPVELSVFEIE